MLAAMTSGPPSNDAQLLDGRYRLGTMLGAGGVAEVYRAIDERLHRGVAIKLFRGDVADQLQRHEDEMRLLAQLNHPNLVTVFDAGTDAATGRPYLVMALVEGATLADQLRDGALTSQRTAEIGTSVADALAYVHGQGLVHRDVKPANVLISNAGRVFLADFGIARLVDSAHVTQAGDVLGTPSFFAPEQVSGEVVGPPADVYALGLVLLECLTGQREYDGTSLEVAMARLSRQPTIPPVLPAAWRDVLAGMTARQAASRLSAAQVADRLRRITAGDDQTVVTAPVAAVAATTQVMPSQPGLTPDSAEPQGKSRRALWITVAIVSALIIGGTALAVALHNNNSPESGAYCPSGVPALSGSLQSQMKTLDDLVCQAPTSEVSVTAAKTLEPFLQTIRTDANGTNRSQLKASIASFNTQVIAFQQSGAISSNQAQLIQNQALEVQTTYLAQTKPKPKPTPTETTPPPSPTPTPTVTTTITVSPPPVTPTETTTSSP
jgi:eukaryotic-like serine/threonine-protein kinase